MSDSRDLYATPGIILPPGVRVPPVEGRDWEYIENEEDALQIRISRADYAGIVFVYKYLALIPPPPEISKDEFDDIDVEYNMVEEEEETAKLKFDFEILENPHQYATKHILDFEILLGDILAHILTDATSNPATKFTMVAKNSEGRIEKLRPIKEGKLRTRVIGVPPKKAGAMSGIFGKIKRFFLGHE